MNIYEAISATMKEIGVVGKNSKNQQQGFMFRGIDAVMNAINPALVKNKIFIVPEILEQTREERTTQKGGLLIYSICKIKYTFYAEDGSSVSAVVIGEGMDSGDKATNKAMSIAFKYACFQVFCIPTEEMVDPDAECHEVAGKKSEKKEPKNKAEEEQANKEMIENVGKEKISGVQLKAFKQRCESDGVPEDLIKALYSLSELSEMTMAQYRNANDNWDKVLAKAKK